jgi:hypothetical protein
MPKELADLKSQFWTASPSIDPKAQWRWRVQIPSFNEVDDASGKPALDSSLDPYVFYAKSIDKPGFSVTNLTDDEYMTAGQRAAPIIVESPTFKKVTMTLIDPVYPNATRILLRYLRNSGFQETAFAKKAAVSGGPSKSYLGAQPRVFIEQLDSNGRPLETWILHNAYPAEVDFGKLDYSSDNLVEITVTWGYQTFSCAFPEIGGEKGEQYLKDTKEADIGRETSGRIGEPTGAVSEEKILEAELRKGSTTQGISSLF